MSELYPSSFENECHSFSKFSAENIRLGSMSGNIQLDPFFIMFIGRY